jgi:hypothetical protein
MAILGTRLTALVGLIATAVLLAGCSTSYHAGDAAARDWASWVKSNPLAGAQVTDAVGTNVQPFQGSFEAFAQLRAPASEKNIVAAMASMCRFDDQTNASTTYWLQIGRVSLQAPCDTTGQHKVAAFWAAVYRLPGIGELAFSTKGIALTSDDAHLTALVPAISKAADASGQALATSANDYKSPHVTITQGRSKDLSTELGLTKGVLDTAASSVKAIEVVAGRVSVATSGSISQAQDWQASVGNGSPVLTVTPAKVSTEVPLTAAGRDLVERLSGKASVISIEVLKPFWNLTVTDSTAARAVVSQLDHERGTHDLGQLDLYAGTSQYQYATGIGRTCIIRPVCPETSGRAAALLDLCDLPEAVEVDDRFDAALDLRLHGTDLGPTLACLHRMPYGLPVYLQLPQGATFEFATGAHLTLKFPQATRYKNLETVWESFGQ